MQPLDDYVGRAGGRVSLEEHQRRLVYAQRYPIPSLVTIAHKYHGKRLIICGGGASLKATLPAIRKRLKLSKNTYVMACNKTHDWLLSKGIKPDFGIMLDPKEWVKDYMTPTKGVKYLIGSTCHESVLHKFKDHDAYIWHPIGDMSDEPMLRRMFPNQGMAMVSGYSTVGLRSVYVADALGFDECELHGFDSCYDPEAKDLYAYRKDVTVHDPFGVTLKANDGTSFKCVSNRMMGRQIGEFKKMAAEMAQAQKLGHVRKFGMKVAGDGAIPWQAWKMGIHTNPDTMLAKYGTTGEYNYTTGDVVPALVVNTFESTWVPNMEGLAHADTSAEVIRNEAPQA